MRITDMPENQITAEEIAHMAGRRTADELTAHLLTTMSDQIKALTAQIEQIKDTLHNIQLAMATERGDGKNLEQRVENLEERWDAWVKQISAIIVIFFVGIVYAIAQGAGVKIR